MTSRQIEMTWRCTSCSAKNLGRFKVCQQCRNPKDGSEEYEMPEDPSKAASVTEEGLLRMALAGPDWRCAYCGSDQRRTDKGCASCGASALEGEEVPDEPAPRSSRAESRDPPRSSPRDTQPAKGRSWTLPVLGVLALLTVVCLGTGSVVRWNDRRPKDFSANVADVKWERVIEVERYQARSHDGFREDLPEGALQVKSLGQREHHQEQVFDHNETERYTVEVPDGYRTETYSERESCGQDCTSTPKSCSERCTSNKNGFATCKTTCTGGGRSCTTKYCDRRKTRQVPKTRTESRTRQVPRYRSEPRYAEAFSWVSWEWLHHRTARVAGTDVTTRWPEANLNKDLAKGEQEREQRRESFWVSLSYDEDKTYTFAPANEEAFAKFAPGTKHQVHTENGVVLVDGARY